VYGDATAPVIGAEVVIGAVPAGLKGGAEPKVGAIVVAAGMPMTGETPSTARIVGGGTRSAVVNGFVTVGEVLLQPTRQAQADRSV
jgi:hypothetical protein